MELLATKFIHCTRLDLLKKWWSRPVEVGGMYWQFRIKQWEEIDSLGFAIKTVPKKFTSEWNVKLTAKVSIATMDGSPPIVKETDSLPFNPSSLKSDYLQVCDWEEIEKHICTDQKVGFVVRIDLRLVSTGLRFTRPRQFTDPNEPRSDVIFLINGEKVYVNKELLSEYSPVIYALFNSDFAEKNKKEIELNDVDREEFIEMLQVVHPPYKAITERTVEFLLKLGDQFLINTLVHECELFLMSSLYPLWIDRMLLADRFHLVHLQDRCFAQLDGMASGDRVKIRKDPQFRKLPEEAKNVIRGED